jgi:uncharacterized membrane protein
MHTGSLYGLLLPLRIMVTDVVMVLHFLRAGQRFVRHWILRDIVRVMRFVGLINGLRSRLAHGLKPTSLALRMREIDGFVMIQGILVPAIILVLLQLLGMMRVHRFVLQVLHDVAEILVGESIRVRQCCAPP